MQRWEIKQDYLTHSILCPMPTAGLRQQGEVINN